MSWKELPLSICKNTEFVHLIDERAFDAIKGTAGNGAVRDDVQIGVPVKICLLYQAAVVRLQRFKGLRHERNKALQFFIVCKECFPACRYVAGRDFFCFRAVRQKRKVLEQISYVIFGHGRIPLSMQQQERRNRAKEEKSCTKILFFMRHT